MYVSGHILTSVLLARGTAKRLKITLGAAAACMIAASLIDADHLFNYRLDDGTLSSFGLHPLHQYWYLTLSVIAAAALTLKRWRPYLLAVLLGVGLHFCMDLLANSVHYNIVWLLVADVACYIAALLLLKRKTNTVLFLTASLLIPNLVNGFLFYILKIAPDASPVYHYATSIMLSAAAFGAFHSLKHL